LRRQSRLEKQADVKRRLLAAGIKIVGQYGYADASIARITIEADVAQGTFYLHFDDRQAFLDQLLPIISREIIANMRDRLHDELTEEEREVERWRAFFEALRDTPGFFRILHEAELFAPEGYRQLMDEIVEAYARALRHGVAPDHHGGYSDKELKAVVHILLGARLSLGKLYADAKDNDTVPDFVISAYEKLITGGLFGKSAPGGVDLVSERPACS
jgi:AcrR family transcriptional regulator